MGQVWLDYLENSIMIVILDWKIKKRRKKKLIKLINLSYINTQLYKYTVIQIYNTFTYFGKLPRPVKRSGH